MNKKAQLGKILTTLPVLIIIIIIMAIYIAASGALSLKGPSEKQPFLETNSQNNLMLQSITIQVDNQEKELLVLDALYLMMTMKLSSDPRESEEMVFDEIKKLINEDQNCYLIHSDLSSNYRSYKYPGNDIDFLEFNVLSPHALRTTIKSDQLAGTFTHYYGRCPENV